MRVLYLTNGFPFPLISGYLRHYHFIRELANEHEITLLSIARPSFREEHRAELAPFTQHIEVFVASGRGRSTARKALRAVRNMGRPDSAIGAMRVAIQRLHAAQPFDVVLFSGKPTYAAIQGLELPPVVADFTDAASMRIRGQMEHANSLKLLGLWVKARQVQRLERQIVARADHLIFASVRDREAVLSDSSTPSSVMPSGVDIDFWQRSTRALGRSAIVFTGAMNYQPNIDAALFLINDIFPRIQAAHPEAELLIVGHSPVPALVAAGQRPGVTVTGFVDDVRPYLERAAVFAAPLRFGAGIQNKVLEAMAMEVPVVATPLAADGLNTENGDHPPLKLAHTADEFARLIGAEIQARAQDTTPDTAARDYIMAHFLWSEITDKLNAVLCATARGN